MKRILTLIFIVGTAVGTYAQEGRLQISQDPKIDELLKIYGTTADNSDFYRIQIYFGSLDTAKQIQLRADGDFPGWYSKIDFISPSYRVRVGQFKSKLDAERNLIEVRKKYPSAMLLQPEKKQS
ncbi:MAG: SPOR domain-containing protein [Sediminicola sp.]